MKILILLLVLFSAPVFAKWSGATDIKQIYPHSKNNSSGTIYLKFGKMINPSGCKNAGLIALKKSNNLSSELYSLILSAAMSNSNVNYYVAGCDAHGYPNLAHMTLSL